MADYTSGNHIYRHRSQSSADYSQSLVGSTSPRNASSITMPKPIGRTASMPMPIGVPHASSMPNTFSAFPVTSSARQMPMSSYTTSPYLNNNTALSFSPPDTTGYYNGNGGRSWAQPSLVHAASFQERESRWGGAIDIISKNQNFEGGIASTNVSPFTRDASHLPFNDNVFGHEPHTRHREHSLGPVGSGRRRAGDPLWSPARSLAFTHEGIEDDNSDDENFIPPTRSGATSRRHSLATLPGRNQQFGFSVPDPAPLSPALGNQFNNNNNRGMQSGRPTIGIDQALGGLRLSDDDLAASLNSLQLSMQAKEVANVGDRSPGIQRQQAPQFPFFQSHLLPQPQSQSLARPPQPVSQQGQRMPSRPPPEGPLSNLDLSTRPVYFGAQTVQEPDIAEFGRGIPLHSIPAGSTLFIVEFKNGRTDIFYSGDKSLSVQTRDMVIVEADRGKDLGTVVQDKISLQDVQAFQQQQVEQALGHVTGHLTAGSGANPPPPQAMSRLTREVHPKRILSKATQTDLQLLSSKAADEAKALAVCRNKVIQKALEMEITDAEWQFDRRKLTLFYIADKRIDFRELVRELFRLYKTRIWMSPVAN